MRMRPHVSLYALLRDHSHVDNGLRQSTLTLEKHIYIRSDAAAGASHFEVRCAVEGFEMPRRVLCVFVPRVCLLPTASVTHSLLSLKEMHYHRIHTHCQKAVTPFLSLTIGPQKSCFFRHSSMI
ncbi:hypothetical protein TcWFU_006142 [Taenia crassiceps]|uniref:Uncharacterized protein n=1 Tax=Taenia crassiceps TaxID=6207 RepID=A0ABR4QRD6_9CEST